MILINTTIIEKITSCCYTTHDRLDCPYLGVVNLRYCLVTVFNLV